MPMMQVPFAQLGAGVMPPHQPTNALNDLIMSMMPEGMRTAITSFRGQGQKQPSSGPKIPNFSDLFAAMGIRR